MTTPDPEHESRPKTEELGFEWTPATSAPGELYTVEGRIEAVGAFTRGLKNDDPRLRPYRRQMWRSGLLVLAFGVAALAVAVVLTAIF